MGAAKKQLMAETMDDMGGAAFVPHPAQAEILLAMEDFKGEFPLQVSMRHSRPLSKKEIAFNKKFAFRLKTTAKFLGREVTPAEFGDIHLTLTRELEET